MTMKLIFALPIVCGCLQGCMIFDPYVTQPQPATTLANATKDLDALEKELNYLIKEQAVVGGITGLATLIGFGGAGISAIFHASLSSILVFTTVGASSLAFNGLYTNPPRIAIYHAGIDAVTCVKRAAYPFTSHQQQLINYQKSLQDREDAVLKRLKETSTTPTASNPSAQEVLDKAEDTKRQIQSKLARGDVYADAIINTTSSIVSTLNAQLRTVVPDAATLARVGSSLNTQIVAGVPQQQANTGKADKKVALETILSLEGLPFDAGPDEALAKYINNLQAEINEVTPIIMADITPPSIECKVANAPTIKPMKIVLAGSKNITFPTSNEKLSFPIEGGTTPYTNIQWIGLQPTCFTSVIQSPNTLNLSSVSGQTCKADDKYTFDIFDVQGQHLSEPVDVIIK